MKDQIQIQTSPQLHEHISQLHNDEFDLIEVCEENKTENTLDNPSGEYKNLKTKHFQHLVFRIF